MSRGIRIQHENKEVTKKIIDAKSVNSAEGNVSDFQYAPEQNAPVTAKAPAIKEEKSDVKTKASEPQKEASAKKEFDVKKALQMEMFQKMRG